MRQTSNITTFRNVSVCLHVGQAALQSTTLDICTRIWRGASLASVPLPPPSPHPKIGDKQEVEGRSREKKVRGNFAACCFAMPLFLRGPMSVPDPPRPLNALTAATLLDCLPD